MIPNISRAMKFPEFLPNFFIFNSPVLVGHDVSLCHILILYIFFTILSNEAVADRINAKVISLF